MVEDKDLSTRELIKRYKELYSIIYVSECYGVNDLIELSKLSKLLLERGYEIEENITLSIKKVK